MTFRPYRKKGVTEMRPYVPGEDLSGVSVSETDTPEEGGEESRRSVVRREAVFRGQLRARLNKHGPEGTARTSEATTITTPP